MTPIDKAIDRFTKIMQRGYDHYHDEKHVQECIQALRELQSLDVEALKINDGKRRGDAGAVSNRIYEDGWNSCVDHLAARGLIGSPPKETNQ